MSQTSETTVATDDTLLERRDFGHKAQSNLIVRTLRKLPTLKADDQIKPVTVWGDEEAQAPRPTRCSLAKLCFKRKQQIAPPAVVSAPTVVSSENDGAEPKFTLRAETLFGTQGEQGEAAAGTQVRKATRFGSDSSTSEAAAAWSSAETFVGPVSEMSQPDGSAGAASSATSPGTDDPNRWQPSEAVQEQRVDDAPRPQNDGAVQPVQGYAPAVQTPAPVAEQEADEDTGICFDFTPQAAPADDAIVDATFSASVQPAQENENNLMSWNLKNHTLSATRKGNLDHLLEQEEAETDRFVVGKDTTPKKGLRVKLTRTGEEGLEEVVLKVSGGRTGVVTDVSPEGLCRVRWGDDRREHWYRTGKFAKFELKCVQPADRVQAPNPPPPPPGAPPAMPAAARALQFPLGPDSVAASMLPVPALPPPASPPSPRLLPEADLQYMGRLLSRSPSLPPPVAAPPAASSPKGIPPMPPPGMSGAGAEPALPVPLSSLHATPRTPAGFASPKHPVPGSPVSASSPGGRNRGVWAHSPRVPVPAMGGGVHDSGRRHSRQSGWESGRKEFLQPPLVSFELGSTFEPMGPPPIRATPARATPARRHGLPPSGSSETGSVRSHLSIASKGRMIPIKASTDGFMSGEVGDMALLETEANGGGSLWDAMSDVVSVLSGSVRTGAEDSPHPKEIGHTSRLRRIFERDDFGGFVSHTTSAPPLLEEQPELASHWEYA